MTYPPIPSVCVIGAGASGISAIKALKDEGVECICFEFKADVGGTWLEASGEEKGDDEIFFASPIYKNLRTNLPTDVMAYRDLAFPELRPGETFPDAKFVEDYLKTYAKHFNLYPSIRFNIKVVNVEWRQSEKMWEVLIEDCKDYSRSMHFFRSVIVANGHFNKPIIPRDIQGLHDDDQFKGVVMHSKTYRRPDVPLFEGKRIIVVGGGSSGNDIANDLLSVAAQIFHSTKDESNVAQSSPLREKINVGRIIRCFGGNRVELSDGQILNDIDVILFATGYYYDFPFLRGLCAPQHTDPHSVLTTDGISVSNLYRGIFYIPNPSLSFIGLHVKLDPFPLFQMQSLLIARSLVVGFDAILPEKNEQEMRRFEDAETMRLSQLFGKEYSHLTSDKMKLVLGTRDQEWQYAYWDDISRIIDRPDLLVQQARIDRRKDALIQRKKDRGY